MGENTQQIHAKKIGDYLQENNFCDAETITRALEQQSALKDQGIFRPLGSIIIEDVGLTMKDLDKVLAKMHLDILSSAPLLEDIPKESLEKTISIIEQRVLPENTIIFNKGDDGDTFFIVISGKVQVYIPMGDETERVLTELKAGEGFGETALLTGEPRSTSVRTLESTSLLVLTDNYFDQICDFCPEFSNALVKILADRLRKGYQELSSPFHNEKG